MLRVILEFVSDYRLSKIVYHTDTVDSLLYAMDMYAIKSSNRRNY